MLILYGTSGCHLCHDAQEMLQQSGITWQDIDIIDDDALLERYGTRIPVLRQGIHELNWPFHQQDILHLLKLTKPQPPR